MRIFKYNNNHNKQDKKKIIIIQITNLQRINIILIRYNLLIVDII